MRNRKISSRNNQKRMIIYGAGIFIPLAIIAILSVVLFGSGKDRGIEKDTIEASTKHSDIEVMEEGDLIKGSSQGDGEVLLPVVSKTKVEEKKEKASNTITEDTETKEVTAVEVAPVDDKEDPQPKGSKGAKANVSELKVPKDKKKTMTYGIDVAKWQGVIDWKKVKASGVEYAMIRVGYRTQVTGVIYEDPYAKYNLQQAQANKIKIGVYFFSTAVNKDEALEEAKWVTGYIAPYRITYPVAFNCEGFTNKENRQFVLSKEKRSNIAKTFLDYVKGEGYTPMFYASRNELEQNSQWNTDALSRDYKIWVAQYPEKPYPDTKKADYTGKHDMWQYTSKGKVSGIDNYVDINLAYFSYKKEAKAKDTSPQEIATADPTALIDFKEVKETVTAKLETNLRSVPSTSDKKTIVTVLKNGDTATRTGVGNNGWSRLKYKGRILYAVSSYLTTDLQVKTEKQEEQTAQPEEQLEQETGLNFKKVNEQVTAKKETNLRNEPSSDNSNTIIMVLKNGDTATRTGISDHGWSRVEYEGKVLYAVSSYLTTDLEYEQNSKPTLDNPEAGITFKEVKEEVTAKEVTNLRLIPSSDNADTIVTALHNGEIAVRTGVGNNGWSRLEYNGQTLYAVTSFLKTVTS